MKKLPVQAGSRNPSWHVPGILHAFVLADVLKSTDSMQNEGLSFLLPRCRSWPKHTAPEQDLTASASEPGILSGGSLSLEQLEQMMLWANRTAPQRFSLQAKDEGVEGGRTS